MSGTPEMVVDKRRVLVNSTSGALTMLVNVSFIVWLYQYLLARVPAEGQRREKE